MDLKAYFRFEVIIPGRFSTLGNKSSWNVQVRSKCNAMMCVWAAINEIPKSEAGHEKTARGDVLEAEM